MPSEATDGIGDHVAGLQQCSDGLTTAENRMPEVSAAFAEARKSIESADATMDDILRMLRECLSKMSDFRRDHPAQLSPEK